VQFKLNYTSAAAFRQHLEINENKERNHASNGDTGLQQMLLTCTLLYTRPSGIGKVKQKKRVREIKRGVQLEGEQSRDAQQGS